jgi:NAD(P)-dependent dehydrogenase (short-subunit alcohol dehydrogenase family)
VAQLGRLDGRVAIVTGAGRGIGRAHAVTLAALGAAVVVNDSGGSSLGDDASEGPASAVAAAINAAGGVAAIDTNPVGTAERAAAIVDAALAQFDRVDILVNNAGVARAGWDTTLEVHLSGAYWLCKQVWPIFIAQRHGRIVNTTSSMGLFGSADVEGADSLDFYAYAAAKMGLVGLTRNLAMLGEPYGIRVNAIAPLAWSRMASEHPDRRFANWLERHFPPEHVARVVAVLASDECPCNGRTLAVGGGRVAEVVVAEQRGRLLPDIDAASLAASLVDPAQLVDLEVPASSQDEIALFDRLVRKQAAGGPPPQP